MDAPRPFNLNNLARRQAGPSGSPETTQVVRSRQERTLLLAPFSVSPPRSKRSRRTAWVPRCDAWCAPLLPTSPPERHDHACDRLESRNTGGAPRRNPPGRDAMTAIIQPPRNNSRAWSVERRFAPRNRSTASRGCPRVSLSAEEATAGSRYQTQVRSQSVVVAA